jgi:lipopolysaccharide transport system permease protein
MMIANRVSKKQRVTYLRDLLRELVIRDMKLRYKRSVLGIAWSLLNPLIQLLVYVFVFDRMLHLGIPNYPIFVFTGVLAYTWFQAALFESTGAITANRELVKRPGFPTTILPLATVTTHMVHFLLALPILLGFVLFGGGGLTPAIVALPVVIAIEFLLILSLGYLVATLQVTFRDTQYLLGVALLLLFFLSPVFYDASTMPGPYQIIYTINPIAHLLTAYRTILLDGQMPPPLPLAALGILTIGLLWLGYHVFVRASYRFVEEL